MKIPKQESNNTVERNETNGRRSRSKKIPSRPREKTGTEKLEEHQDEIKAAIKNRDAEMKEIRNIANDMADHYDAN